MTRLEKAKKEHELWLRKMGVNRPKRAYRGAGFPDYSTKKNAELSNSVGNGFAKESNKYSGDSDIAVSQLYNKGGYGVVGKAELADPALGKRRV